MQQPVNWPGWEFVRKLGSGSYGSVYEIRQQVGPLERRAALKVIPVPRDENELENLAAQGYDAAAVERSLQEQVEDVIREYSVMTELKGHTNIVYCEDIRCVERPNGRGKDVCMQMELLTPVMRTQERGSEAETALHMGRDLLQALSLCRKRKIVHRDIKPQNIFVSRDGDYKLGDFGVAKTMDRTGSATMIGTINYMAPEVRNNEHYGAAADLYSLGMVLYWILNERHLPFVPILDRPPRQSEIEQAAARRFAGETLPPPKHGDAELKSLVCSMCAFRPEDRPNADSLLTAFLRLMLADSAPAPEPVVLPEPDAPMNSAAEPEPTAQEDATQSIWEQTAPQESKREPVPAPKPERRPEPQPKPQPEEPVSQPARPASLRRSILVILLSFAVYTVLFAVVWSLKQKGVTGPLYVLPFLLTAVLAALVYPSGKLDKAPRAAAMAVLSLIAYAIPIGSWLLEMMISSAVLGAMIGAFAPVQKKQKWITVLIGAVLLAAGIFLQAALRVSVLMWFRLI